MDAKCRYTRKGFPYVFRKIKIAIKTFEANDPRPI